MISGDTTGLSKALSGINKDIKNTQSQLKDVERLLKLDPSNTELLSQKQKLLKEAIGETKEKLKQLKSVQDQMEAGLANGSITQDQYDNLEGELEGCMMNEREALDYADAHRPEPPYEYWRDALSWMNVERYATIQKPGHGTAFLDGGAVFE